MCSSNYWENQESRISLTALVLARVDGGEYGMGRQRQTLGKSVRSRSLSKLFPTLPLKLNFWTIFYLTQSNQNIISPYIMGWIVFPQIHVETLTSELTIFGDTVFTEVIKVKWGHQSGPNHQGGWSRTPDCCLMKRRDLHTQQRCQELYVHREKIMCRVEWVVRLWEVRLGRLSSSSLRGENWSEIMILTSSNPLAVFLPGESHEQRTLAGYSPWGHKESDTTEMT